MTQTLVSCFDGWLCSCKGLGRQTCEENECCVELKGLPRMAMGHGDVCAKHLGFFQLPMSCDCIILMREESLLVAFVELKSRIPSIPHDDDYVQKMIDSCGILECILDEAGCLTEEVSAEGLFVVVARYWDSSAIKRVLKRTFNLNKEGPYHMLAVNSGFSLVTGLKDAEPFHLSPVSGWHVNHPRKQHFPGRSQKRHRP